MSSTRTTPRTTINRSSSSTLNSHHTNGSTNSFDTNDSSNTSEFDSNLQRSVLMKNLPHSDGIYKNPRFIHQISVGLLGQPVVVQTNEQERYHGILETIAFNGDVLLAAAHRIENNTNDITTLSTALIDLVDTVDSSVQSFDLQKRTIPGANIVEMIAIDIDLTGSGKCMLDEAPKVTQLEDDRFNRMEHFYGADDIDAETFEELDLGDDGKAGYDPEDMFTTNKEKFNTKTDFDEGKYTNVPLRELTAEEQAEVDKKAYEIEKGIKNEDVDEDDAGVKRPSEYNQTHSVDDGNSNPKSNQSSRMHSNNERRQDFRIDGDYNSQKRGGWRDQRPTGNTNRRGGQNNYSMNANKPNQRSDQPQYTSSRSSEQTTNNRSQQYNKPRNTNNRYQENLSPHEGRDSPLQISNDDPARPQRMNSGSFSQGQNSGPTSPSTNVPARNMYGRNSGQPIGRNSPAPYTGSSSSRNNSTNATSPPPASSSATGNYSQQSNNKMNNKKQSRNDQQTVNEDNEQPKPQRNQQQQQQQNSSNNQSNTVPPTRPSQLHTQQVKQQQQQQQSQTSSANNNNNIPPPLALPNQDDHLSSHETINPNQSDSNTHLTNAPLYSQHTAGATTPGNAKGNSGLNPEADEFVPGHPRDSNSRPESRGASTNSMPVNSYLSQPHPQTLQLLQQQVQQTQVQQPSMIPPTHPQNSALYSPFYQAQFTGMQPFVNATPQPMNVGMMGTAMMPPQTQQSLPTNGPNAGNPNTTGMTTPNGASGPGYKPNTNAAHGGETGNTNLNNTAPKKAVVSVQRPEQSNILQQQQVAGGPPMTYPAPPPVRYYQPEYMQQPMTPQSMQLQQMPLYYPINTLNIPAAAVAAGVGPSQNIMISSAGSSGGPATQVPSSFYYTGGVYADPRYSVYQPTGPVNPSNANSNWQMARSPPHQQQQPPSDQQRGYGGGQNVVPQAPPQSGVPNTNTGGGSGGAGRSASTSGPSGQSGPGAGGPPMTPQYALNSGIQAAYAYAPQQAWYPAQSQVSSPQTNMPSQVNVYGMMYDPSQQASQQPPTYVHQNPYDAAAYFQQAQQQPPSQQGLDTVPTGNYNR